MVTQHHHITKLKQVPQGNILFPDLFNVYPTDILETPNTILATYVDNTVILSPKKGIEETASFLPSNIFN